MAQIPPAEKGTVCPLHRVDVSKVCHKCPWWTQIRGTNPNSGEPVDRWQCAIAWLPMLLIENTQMQHQTGAAVESFRNGMVAGVIEAVGQAAENAGRLLDAPHDRGR
jgi:hypothetical protein